MKYVVLSYGRPDLQITLQSIPEKHLKSVDLMVVPSEYKAYKKGWYADKVNSIECWPKHIDCVPKKRKYAALNFTDDYMMIDDDIQLYVWSKAQNKFVRPDVEPKQFDREWTERIPALFKKYPCVSLGNKFMADPWVRENGLFNKNTLGFVCSGFSRTAPVEDIKFNRVFAFTDISLPLQMWKLTGRSLVYYGLCYNHAVRKELLTTGMSTYRDDFVKVDSAIKMARMFPGIVTGLKKTNAAGGGYTLTKFFSRVNKGVTHHNKEATKQFLRESMKKYGLRELPRLFEYEDEMPRAEIIKLFKSNWKKARL